MADKEREAFEAEMGARVSSIHRAKIGSGYLYADAQRAWEAWQARASLSSSGAGDAAVETGWMPIESAPKDRTEILLSSETGRRSIETGAYLQNMIHAAKVDGEDCFYVGWMPLPPAIERAVIAQKGKGERE